MIDISSAFDGGNIAVVDAERPEAIRLRINKDAGGEFYQWFHFRLAGARDAQCHIEIGDLKGSAYPGGWSGYRAVASYDREHWFRVETGFDGDSLHIRLRPERDLTYFAYFAPYSSERHHDLVARTAQSERVRHQVLGHSLDGRAIDLLTIGAPGDGKPHYWLIARQHPGETMAEWWMEGALDRLTDPADPVALALLDRAVFHIVPNMNPDGSARGYLRTNTAGANLNREWANPTLERSPEVLAVRDQMDRTGVDFFLDVHGDESIPHNFIAGFEGIPSITQPQLAQLDAYKQALLVASPDFQTRAGYPPASPGRANLGMATNQVAERFGCLAMTLEMPFKDNADRPDLHAGWSPARSRHLGRACLDALLQTYS